MEGGADNEPAPSINTNVKSGNPSSNWPKYTDSLFSEKHLDK